MKQTKLNPLYFVNRVNEIYHDIEGEAYLQKHPEIFVDEAKRWRMIAKRYLVKDCSITVLDIGTGTGFVPLTIAPFLKMEDTIICSDISSGMLEVCKSEIRKRQFECTVKFVKSRGDITLLVQKPVDFITMNSVLHHIPNVEEFCSQIKSVLSEEGIAIIAHEPNKPFFHNRFLWNNYVFLNRLLNLRIRTSSLLRAKVSQVLKRFGLFSPASRLLSCERSQHERKTGSSNDIITRVNMCLLREELVEKPLSASEISKIVDFHSPTAGGFQKERCLDFQQLLEGSLINFELIHFETYNHCYKETSKSQVIKLYANLLRVIYPKQGGTFLAVIKKKH